MNETYAREVLTDICYRLYERKLTVSAGGNMSMRLNEKEILITPSGKNKGMIQPDELVKMNMDGTVTGPGKPSVEHKFHLALYKKNPDTNAVIHCHPLHCTAIAVKGTGVRSDLTPEGVILLGDVPMVDYYAPGSDELTDAISAKSQYKAIILRRHGAITQGATVEEAFNRMEELEFQANLRMIVGRVRGLRRTEIDDLERL